MFIIQAIDLGGLAIAAMQSNLRRVQRNNRWVLTIEPGHDASEFLTPSLHPRMAHQFEGFECSSEMGVQIAVGVPTDQGFQGMVFTSEWQPSDEALVFYSPEEIRQFLPAWVGGRIQFCIRLERFSDGTAPEIEFVKVGYHVNGDIFTYICEFGLPEYFRQEVKLSRWVVPNSSLTVPLPGGLDLERIQSPLVFAPELKVQHGQLTPGSPPFVSVSSPLPSTPVHLTFSYTPKVEFIDGFYQLTELPCVFLRLLTKENEYQLFSEDSIRLADGQSRISGLTMFYSYLMEATIAAETREDVRAIGNRLMWTLDQSGFIELHPYGLLAPLQLKRGLTLKDGDTQIGSSSNNMVKMGTFRFAVLGITEGEGTYDVTTLEKIDQNLDVKVHYLS